MRHQDRIEAWILEADLSATGAEGVAQKGLQKSDPEQGRGQDPQRDREREEVHAVWNLLRRECQGLGLPEDFGEDRVRQWSRPRPEGVLFGTPLALAASLIFMVTLVPAMGCMRELGIAVDSASAADSLHGSKAEGRSVNAGSAWSALPGKPVNLKLRGGRSLQLDEGSVRILSARHWSLESTLRLQLQADLPAGETLVEVPGGILRSREARYSLHSGGDGGLRLEVQEGTVAFERGERGGITRLGPGRGLDILPPRGGEGSSAAPQPPTGDRTRLPDPPPTPETHHGVEGDEIHDGEQREELRGGAAEDWALAVLEGRVHDSGAQSQFEQRRLRLTRVGFVSSEKFDPPDDLLAALRRQDLIDAARARVVEQREAFIDDQGDFRIELNPGYWNIEVIAPGRRDQALGGHSLYPGRELWIEPELQEQRVLRGRLLDDEGRAIEGARVSGRTREVWSGADGRFELPGSGAAETVVVEAEGWAPATWTLGGGQVNDTLILQRGASWAVDFLAQQGGQVDGARVRAEWMEGGLRRRVLGRPGPGGSQVLTGLPVVGDFVLISEAPGWQTDRRVLQGRGLGNGRERVEMASGRSLSLQVRGPSQEPLMATGSLLQEGVLRAARAGEGAELIFEGLCSQASGRGVVQAPQHRIRALALEGLGDTAGEVALEKESGVRRLELSTGAGQPLAEAWGFWVIRDASTASWIHARSLPAVDRGVLQLPDLCREEFAAAGLDVILFVGGAGVQAQWVEDEGQRVQTSTLGDSLHSR